MAENEANVAEDEQLPAAVEETERHAHWESRVDERIAREPELYTAEGVDIRPPEVEGALPHSDSPTTSTTAEHEESPSYQPLSADAEDIYSSDDGTEVQDTTADDGEQTVGPISTNQRDLNGKKESGMVPDTTQQPAIQVDAPQESVNSTGGSTPPSTATASRERTDSMSTNATTDTAPTSSPRSSLIFVVSALENIAASKDARRRKELGDATQQALQAIKGKGDPRQINPNVLFIPLKMATEGTTETVVTTALDCIGKLISYSYFSAAQEGQASHESLIDLAIDAICDCFEGEATAAGVQLQIIKSLLAAVLNDKVIVHGAGLLKAVRQIYNIFLLSKNSTNQQVAQGTLSQMVGTVFERARVRVSIKEARSNLSKATIDKNASEQEGFAGNGTSTPSDLAGEGDEGENTADHAQDPQDRPVEKDNKPKITLQTFERRGSFDEDQLREGPTRVTRMKMSRSQSQISSIGDQSPALEVSSRDQQPSEEDDEDEIFMKDAFLVFRSMCKISIKSLPAEQIVELKSQGMRAKLLSLHIIHSILFNNMTLFLSPQATIKSSQNNDLTPFTQAIKQLLCQSLSRNGASSANKVFEVGCEIFWLMLKNLRVILKREVEVFLKEIYFAILENRNAPTFQKQCFLNVLGRLSTNPRALVEIYLNYDCDRTALDNMFQRLIEHLSRMSSVPVAVTPVQQQAYLESQAKKTHGMADWQLRGTMPPSLTTSMISVTSELDNGYSAEYGMKQQSLESLVEILRSIIHWAQQGMNNTPAVGSEFDSSTSIELSRDSVDLRPSGGMSPMQTSNSDPMSVTGSAPLAEDDPNQLEKAKQRKTALIEGVKQFNFKPKRGIKYLLKEGFIQSDTPEDVAQFLLANEQLDKAAKGEFMGEGDEYNVAIMHAFVDCMDFTRTRFVDALRRFLQSFRLPGEAQKIDRFMLKFAERYILGNPNAFANADTAYVLAYSVIMLNTDQHSTKLKGKRMTPEDFIKNNKGINDNGDLPEEYLRGIFDEIAHREIVLDTERENAERLGLTSQPAAGLRITLGNVGRDLQREAYVQKSEEMANKTEKLFKSLIRAQKRGNSRKTVDRFIPASSFRHVGPMFEVTWVPFLTALSGAVQDTNNLELIKLYMDGLKVAVQVSCLFDLETPRQAFVAAISRFTNLYNLSEMKAKNVEALRILLDVAYTEGNFLKESWREILTCISQLDRFQLISAGVDEGTVPDVLKMHSASAKGGRVQGGRAPSSRQQLRGSDRGMKRSANSQIYRSEIAAESRSAEIIRGVDRIFTNTSNLSGEAIIYFARALTQVSWQEIQSSGQSQEPRTYSLQKLVEMSEYNMTRVRFEWTNIWHVLGEHFIEVGCHNNTKVVHFALNSLRQLSVRFFELEELPGFQFQKDFLKPFQLIISNTSVTQVKEIVLHSLIQMIQARGERIRSGWRTMFGVFTIAAQEPYESIVSLAFDNVFQIFNTRLGVVIQQAAFADLVVCLTEFSKNARFQKKSLQAIEALKSSVPKMLKSPECPLSADYSVQPKQPTRQTREEEFWFPVLFAFHDVLMTGDDLEVRSRALNYLFEMLIKYGKDFPREFWDTLWRQLLYPIFMVLKSKSEMSKVVNHEELSVWLSTTMIQALRNMMSLFTYYFESLEYMLDRFLDLLTLCICQENDTLARIGSNCLQTLILQNVNKFTPEHWEKIVSCFVGLFSRTEATALFSAATTSSSANGITSSQEGEAESSSMDDLPISGSRQSRRMSSLSKAALTPINTSRSSSVSKATNGGELATPAVSDGSISLKPQAQDNADLEDYRPESQLQQAPVVVTAARRRFFNQIITKCVLQLLMIETVNELFSNDTVYARIPSMELLRLMALLKKSYHFAKHFNDDWDLRKRLFREGFMKQPPNLLKQESGSASVYVSILFRMYHDEGEERRSNRAQTEAALIPLCVDITKNFLELDEETQQRNIVTWRPVVTDVVEGYANFPTEGFEKHIATFAPLVVGLMGHDGGGDLQRALQLLVSRVFEVKLGVDPMVLQMTPTAVSPRPSVVGSRRSSRVSAAGGR